MKDLFGQAILDYQTKNNPENLWTETTISSLDELPVSYLFRNYAEMPTLEQKALDLCKGKILDVGSGAGSHSLYLQNKGLDVTAVEISLKSAEVCMLRGIKKVVSQDILFYQTTKKFDTILMLMNGTGIFQSLSKISNYLLKLKSLLSENGKIIIDSTDLIYMYDMDEKDGGVWIPNDKYYGEVNFIVHYKGMIDKPFPWLYLDFETLKNTAKNAGLRCRIIMNGDEYNYLAELKY